MAMTSRSSCFFSEESSLSLNCSHIVWPVRLRVDLHVSFSKNIGSLTAGSKAQKGWAYFHETMVY